MIVITNVRGQYYFSQEGNMISSLPSATAGSTQTVIYYSKPKASAHLLLYGVAEGYVIYSRLTEQRLSTGWVFLTLVGLGLLVGIGRQVMHLVNNKPQLTLNAHGIVLAAGPVDLWALIQRERVEAIWQGRRRKYVLCYEVKGKTRKLNIQPLAIDDEQLTALLHQYRAKVDRQATTLPAV